MSYKGDETRIWNAALKNVSVANKRIAENYLIAQENITEKLAAFNIKKTIGLSFNKSEFARLQSLYEQISAELIKLGAKTTRIISTGFKKNYEETYYKTGFSIEKEVNIGTGFKSLTSDYSLSYTLLPTEAVQAALTEEIAGHTFLDRAIRDRRVLQFRVRTAVANAITEGISTQQLAKNLRNVDDAFLMSERKALNTARTEMLRAYSLGQEEAINEAEEAGVEGEEVWSSTLDNRTRPQHTQMDGKKADEEGFFTFPDGVRTKGPRLSGVARHDISCRGRKLFLPYGIKPTKRVAKMPNGKWEKINGDITWQEWAAGLKE